MMLGTSITSFIIVMASSIFGMPISGTHTVIGALIGAGIAMTGSSNINWDNLGVIFASWILAPLISIILCALFLISVCKFTMDTDRKFTNRLLWLQVFAAFVSLIFCAMLIELIKEEDEAFTTVDQVIFCASPIVGLFATRLIVFLQVKPNDTN